MLQAVFWDMDGTIVDTEPLWFVAQQKLAARFGVNWTQEDALGLVGNALPVSARVLQNAGIDLPVDELLQALTSSVQLQVKHELLWRPGARELLMELRLHGIPCVLVTMSHRPLAEEVVAQLPADTFELIVTGEMVTHGKPHPEPYLLAAELLADSTGPLVMERIVAFEDSRPGVTSAHASGVVTVGVPNLVPLPQLHGVTQWTTLAGVTVDDVRRLLTRRNLQAS